MIRRLVLACTLFLPAQVLAQEEPRNAVAVGAYGFVFNSSSTDLAGPFTPPGLRSSVDDTSNPALLYSRFLNPQWSVDLAVGLPPTYTLRGEGAAAGLGALGETRAFTGGLLLRRYFTGVSERITPFAGAGVVVTRFGSSNASASLERALGGPTSISADDIIAPAVTLGFDIPLNPRVFLTAAASYAPMKTDVALTTGTLTRTSEITLDPVIYSATLGYRF